MDNEHRFLKIVQYTYRCVAIVALLVVLLLVLVPRLPELTEKLPATAGTNMPTFEPTKSVVFWSPPDSLSIPPTPEGDLVRYGRELVAHTSYYIGPNGTVSNISNGLNCQNCHLKAGKKIYGNNYSAVFANYPKFRGRSGSVETVEKRVNDCIERSLNGQPLATDSRELKALAAYISWVGSNVQKNASPPGVGLVSVPFLDRPASPTKGKIVFDQYCKQCHGQDGMGVKHENGREWKYPPLWGPASYNTSAGLYRLSKFAGYVKANMPNGSSFENPILTDEEAWDVAAYVNSMPRPEKKFSQDWPDISKKPFDHPFGPYADTFTEDQHKFGPFQKILRKK
jgi:thiosulfate dehydrogenase